MLGTAAIATVLLAVVLVPQLLSRDARLQVLRAHVDEVARLAASAVDGDLHRRLIDGATPGAAPPDVAGPDEAILREARAPLLRLHRAWPEAIYVYTMGVRDRVPFFVLDTAQDPAFAAGAQPEGLAAMASCSVCARNTPATGWMIWPRAAPT